MATLTAVAAGGNWSSASTWSPAQVPTAADNCKITGTMTGTVTIDGSTGSPNLCRSLDCTGATHTLSHSGVLNVGDGSGGLFKLVAGMTYNVGGGAELDLVSTTTGNNITSAGKNLAPMNFNGVGGSWTLQDNLVNCYGITLTNGTLNAGSKTVSTNYFESNNSNTRALTLSGSWTPATWTITNSSGMTLTATSSTITCSNTFSGGGLTYNNVVITVGVAPTIYGANTFANLTYTGTTNPYDSITFAANQTVTTRLTINGNNSAPNRILIKSDIKGTPRTLTTAANTITNADCQDIVGAGASGWNLSAITGKSGDCGGCSGITFTSPINCYMKTAASVSWSASNWYTTSGGSTHARVPLPQDTAIFDANSVTAASVTIDADMPRVGAMDWTGVLNVPVFQAPNVSLFGDITFVSGMYLVTSGGPMTFENRGSINVDSGTTFLGNLAQNGPGGTVNQVADCSTGSLIVINGTWSNGAYAASTGLLTIDGGTFDLGSGSLITVGDGTTAFIISAGTLEMNGNSIHCVGDLTMAISGGVLNLSGQIDGGVTGTLAVSGGTINDTGPAGEIISSTASFTGGTSVIRKLTLYQQFAQSSTSYLKITGSATWSNSWTWSGTDYTFTTNGIPTWSAGSLTLDGGSWTFGG